MLHLPEGAADYGKLLTKLNLNKFRCVSANVSATHRKNSTKRVSVLVEAASSSEVKLGVYYIYTQRR